MSQSCVDCLKQSLLGVKVEDVLLNIEQVESICYFMTNCEEEDKHTDFVLLLIDFFTRSKYKPAYKHIYQFTKKEPKTANQKVIHDAAKKAFPKSIYLKQ